MNADGEGNLPFFHRRGFVGRLPFVATHPQVVNIYFGIDR